MNHVTLDKKRPIRFTYSVLEQVENERDKSFLNLGFENLRWGDLISLCFFGCKKADANFELTREQVADALKPNNLQEIMEAFSKDMVKEEKK